MKKLWIVLVTLLSIMLLAGCQQGTAIPADSVQNTETELTSSFSESKTEPTESESKPLEVDQAEENMTTEPSETIPVREEPSESQPVSKQDHETVTPPEKEDETQPEPSQPPAPTEKGNSPEPEEESQPPATNPTQPDKPSEPTELPKPEPTKPIPSEPEQPPVTEAPSESEPEFDIEYWISYAKTYAESVGLTLNSEAVYCWDNPIAAGAHCIYTQRDIQDCLNRYARDEEITDVWVWAEQTGDQSYELYIGYA